MSDCEHYQPTPAGDKQLGTIFRELLDVAAHWKSIGTLRGVPYHKLQVIDADQSGVHDCLRDMLHTWLVLVSLPTWEDLAKAVEVYDPSKAEDIRKRSVESQYYVFETEI